MEYTYIIFRRKIFCTGFYLGNSLLSCIICLICNYTWENISDTPLKKYIWYFIVLGVACMIIYGHMSLCMHACSLAYAHAYALHACIMCMHMCMWTFLLACVCLCFLSLYECVRMLVHVHVCTYVFLHTCIMYVLVCMDTCINLCSFALSVRMTTHMLTSTHMFVFRVSYSSLISSSEACGGIFPSCIWGGKLSDC